MKYTSDHPKFTLINPPNTEVLSLVEVAQQLQLCGALELGLDEVLGEMHFNGSTLTIDILHYEPDDPRIDRGLKRSEDFDISTIREHFTAADYYAWAKDEDGDDVLLCFGCC